MSDNVTLQPDDTLNDLTALREQIQSLRQEVNQMKEKTAEAEKTLQLLNKLMARVETIKRAKER